MIAATTGEHVAGQRSEREHGARVTDERAQTLTTRTRQIPDANVRVERSAREPIERQRLERPHVGRVSFARAHTVATRPMPDVNGARRRCGRRALVLATRARHRPATQRLERQHRTRAGLHLPHAHAGGQVPDGERAVVGAARQHARREQLERHNATRQAVRVQHLLGLVLADHSDRVAIRHYVFAVRRGVCCAHRGQ